MESAVVGGPDARRARYGRLSRALAHLDGDELAAIVGDGPENGWGSSQEAKVGDEQVFVKRVPLTEIEHDRMFSTRNHFRLPTYYQYGVGSAGFGACRELVTHLKTTAWALDGTHAGFPMLLHHRVTRRKARATRADRESWIRSADYVRYWNGSKRIGSFIEARATAPYELWLVLEHVPHTLHPWLAEHQSAAEDVVAQLLATVSFLHEEGVFHFDAHYGNAVTDGTQTFLTDFGLASDRAFHLGGDERAFLEAHRHYDFGEVVYSLGPVLFGLLARLTDAERRALLRRYQPEGPIDQTRVLELVVEHVDDLAADGTLGVTPAYAAVLSRYREVVLFMARFFDALRTNRRKNTPFDDDRLRSLLEAAGAIAPSGRRSTG